jgi:hypothetical protein
MAHNLVGPLVLRALTAAPYQGDFNGVVFGGVTGSGHGSGQRGARRGFAGVLEEFAPGKTR